MPTDDFDYTNRKGELMATVLLFTFLGVILGALSYAIWPPCVLVVAGLLGYLIVKYLGEGR
jgi:hypothetical protein